MATRKIVPRADNEGGLGTALKRWASAFINALTVNTIALIGGQIAFPATQAPSADVNTLDDYEEGTWVPVLAFGGASVGITYIAQIGNYVKLGKVVFYAFAVTITNKGSSTGLATVSLPFVAPVYQLGLASPPNNLTVTFPLWLSTYGGNAAAYFMDWAGGVAHNLDDTQFANNTSVQGTGFYFV